MTKAEDEVYKMIFVNGKQNLSSEIDSVNFHAMTHEDTETLGMFCDFTAIRGEKLKQLLIRGYLKNNPKAEIQGNWRRILIRNDKGGCIGARMLCPVCNKDNGHDEYMRYCPNCGSRLGDYKKSEEEWNFHFKKLRKGENMVRGDIFTSPIDFALQETIKKFEGDEENKLLYEALRRSRVMWENIRINGLEICGMSYEKFYEQLEKKKHVIFLSDDEIEGFNKAIQIMNMMRS